MKIMTRIPIILATIAVSFAAGTVSAQSPREISFALPSKSFPAAAPRVAEEMGLFAKHGLLPKFTYVDSTAATATTLISKSAEFGETETTSVISAAARGQNLVILSRHYAGLSASLILSKATVEKLGVSPDAPVADRLKALNGILLSTTSRVSSLTISYKAAANAVGAEPRFSYIAVNAAGAALEAGAVEGSILTSPFWAMPVLKGSAVLWLSPSKGDLDPKLAPSAATVTAVTRELAEANPELVWKVAAVFDDFSAAVSQQPDAVKAAYAKLFPDVDAQTLDLILSLESKALNAEPLTAKDIVNDIAYMKMSGSDFGPMDNVDPASLLLKR